MLWFIILCVILIVMVCLFKKKQPKQVFPVSPKVSQYKVNPRPKFRLTPSFMYTEIPSQKTDTNEKTLDNIYNFEISDLEFHRMDPNTRMIFQDDAIHVPDPDSQNVHSSTVQRSIKSKFNEISDSSESFINEISEFYLGDETVQKVLKFISQRNSSINNLDNKTETEIFSDVWKKIKNNENLKSAFCENLKDCIEDGNVVCPTGTTSRALSTLYIEDPENYPKTESLIREEIFCKASKVRDTTLSDKDFQNEITKQIKKDYIDILTENEMSSIIDEITLNI